MKPAKAPFFAFFASGSIGAAVFLVIVVVITAWITRVYEGRRSITASDAAFARGDRVEAIVLARVAAEARCPACAAPDLAFARLQAIAKDAENKGDDATAVAAWRAVRAATLSTITLDASPERRERADQEIARLEHRLDAAAAAAAGGSAPSPAASEERLRVALQTNTMPSSMVFVMLTLGGALFLLGAIRFVRGAGGGGGGGASSFRAVDLATSLAGITLCAMGVLLF